METLAELRTQLATKNEEAAAIRTKIDNRLRHTLVKCKACGQAHEIGHLEYIQTHWYTPPRGCTGGDYWNKGEGNFDCPGCGSRNRLYDQPDVEALKHLFASTVNEHKG